jgi:hypothetical protein
LPRAPATLPVYAGLPAALPEEAEQPAALPEEAAEPPHELDLTTGWAMELVPTVDNTWGDFTRPAGAPVALERREMRHRVEGGETWERTYATFGPHASGLSYSTSRGIHKDPIHRETLGPKGHVPEEFAAFGPTRAGRAARLRTDLIVAADAQGWLAVGAAAAKQGTLDGEPLAFDDHGYLAFAPVRLAVGRHRLDLSLTPDEDIDLRAYVAVVGDRTRFTRPEWIQAGPHTVLSTEVEAGPAVVQVAARHRCLVRLNGVEIGRQGGFEPYAEQETPRVRRYQLAGPGTLSVELSGGAVLVDGAVRSGRHWSATRDGVPVPTAVRRRQYGDPAALHLPRRPHPLPGTDWLEDEPADDTVLPVVLADPDQAPVQWLSFVVPPGATSLALAAYGEVVVHVDGVAVADGAGDPVALTVDLDGQDPGPRECTLRVVTRPGYSHGAILAGPVTFEVGPGTIALGDWQEVGLPEYSGGVRYRRRFPAVRGSIVDLGRVRGTAEVTLNGESLGVRVCAPYTFEVGDALRAGGNELEVLVYNTLAPYLDAVSPTSFVFPGQKVSGLFGPVRLRH